jgi:hypothetical protein
VQRHCRNIHHHHHGWCSHTRIFNHHYNLWPHNWGCDRWSHLCHSANVSRHTAIRCSGLGSNCGWNRNFCDFPVIRRRFIRPNRRKVSCNNHRRLHAYNNAPHRRNSHNQLSRRIFCRIHHARCGSGRE